MPPARDVITMKGRSHGARDAAVSVSMVRRCKANVRTFGSRVGNESNGVWTVFEHPGMSIQSCTLLFHYPVTEVSIRKVSHGDNEAVMSITRDVNTGDMGSHSRCSFIVDDLVLGEPRPPSIPSLISKSVGRVPSMQSC